MLNKNIQFLVRALIIMVFWPFYAIAALQGVGYIRHCPEQGFIEATDSIAIHVESWPYDQSSGARVVFSIDNGANWSSIDMTQNDRLGLHDWWLAVIGPFPAGTVIRYAVEVFDGEGGSLWDNNGGADYYATVNGGAPSRWVGGTSHQPPTGQIGSDTMVTISSQSYPAGEAVSARILLSSNQGWSWSSLDMNLTGSSGTNDVWSTVIGPFPAGSTNMYSVEVTFQNPEEKIWDTNNGANHQLIVNVPFAGQWIGNARHSPPSGDIDAGEDLSLLIKSEAKRS